MFSAARQMGFADAAECPQLCKLAMDYLKRTKGCEDDIYEYLSGEADADSLFVKLTEEFERCILGYFAFHWREASAMINQLKVPKPQILRSKKTPDSLP